MSTAKSIVLSSAVLRSSQASDFESRWNIPQYNPAFAHLQLCVSLLVRCAAPLLYGAHVSAWPARPRLFGHACVHQISECAGVWWRPNFESYVYPYLPPHITKPKECTKIYVVQMPERCTLAVSDVARTPAAAPPSMRCTLRAFYKRLTSIWIPCKKPDPLGYRLMSR